MANRATLCAAIGMAALAAGVAVTASAATVNRTVAHTAPAHATPRVNTVHTPQVRSTTTRTRTTTQVHKLNVNPGGGGGGAKFHRTNVQVSPTTLKPNPNLAVKPNLNVRPNLNASPALKLGPGKVNPAIVKPVNVPIVKLANNKFAPMWKQQHKIWWNGKWKVFVPFTVLSGVLIGGSYFYPDAYVGFSRPHCTGLTPDGCQLNWQMVEFEDGGADWQCVQFCPRPGGLPPPQAAALVAPPPAPAGNCEVTIYSGENFGGTGVSTGEEQPQLSLSGWQNQIASIQVKSGTWDFFPDENFVGNAMRLPPGPYQELGPDWTRKIGSFMCVQPGS